MANIIMVRPGETVSIVGVPTEVPSRPVDPGYGVDIGTGPVRPAHPIYLPPSGPVDPGYGVDSGLRPSHPIWYPTPGPGQPPGSHPPVEIGGGPIIPVDPEHPWVPPSGPVDPGYSPPWAQVPDAPDGGGGVWVWAYSPQTGRWMWVRVPGKGEAGPK